MKFYIILSICSLCVFFVSCIESEHSKESSASVLCKNFESLSPGSIVLTINGNDVSVDWTNNLQSNSDSLNVDLNGASSFSASQKPSSFNGLSDGAWNVSVTYSLLGCNSISTTRSFTINTAIDCTDWDSYTIASSITSSPSVGAVSVSWAGGNISGEDSYNVTVSGVTADKTITNSNPAVFSGMSPGNHSATILYTKSGCTDKTQSSGTFTIPTSFTDNVLPLLNSCDSCHGSSGSFTVSYSDLTSETTSVCGTTEYRVLAGDSTNSAFYKKITSSACGTQMGSPPNGSLSTSDIEVIKTWIDEGAQNN